MKIQREIIIVLGMALLLTGCGKSKEAQAVDDQIVAIGEVSLESEELIVVAENAYSALSSDDKDSVEGYGKLKAAREEYDKLVEEQKPLLISDKIKAVNEDPLSYSKDEIKKIVDEFDSLTDDQKENVESKNFVNNIRNLDVDKIRDCKQAVDKISESSSIEEAASAYKMYQSLNSSDKKFINISAVEKIYLCNDLEKAAVGACVEIKKYLKSSESFNLIKSTVVDDRKGGTGQYLVKTKYSATNGFGARIDDTSLLPISPSSFTDPYLGLGALTTGKIDLYDSLSDSYYYKGTAVEMNTEKISYWIENRGADFFK